MHIQACRTKKFLFRRPRKRISYYFSILNHHAEKTEIHLTSTANPTQNKVNVLTNQCDMQFYP